jgi:hypothetical protein
VRALRDAQPLRAERAQAAGTTPSPDVDVVGVLRALDTAGVRHVVVGEVAETLRGLTAADDRERVDDRAARRPARPPSRSRQGGEGPAGRVPAQFLDRHANALDA